MSRPKRKTVTRRKFVGNGNCMGAVSWEVSYGEGWNHKKRDRWCFDAEFNVSDSAQGHYVSRKADLRPLYRMQKELNDFIEELESAVKAVEEHNAES